MPLFMLKSQKNGMVSPQAVYSIFKYVGTSNGLKLDTDAINDVKSTITENKTYND